MQLFVGNIDKSISFDEVKNYFYSRFSSIISAKLIVNQETGRSKGYAFFEFSNYKEFCQALNIKEPLIFGKQKLVLNSAKNRLDYDKEDKINELENIKISEERKSLGTVNSLGQTAPLSSAETGGSSIRNSKESSSSQNSHSFLGNKIKPEISNYNIMDKDSDLDLLIKDSLKKLSDQYQTNEYENKSSLFNYYCTPFLHNNYNKKDYYFDNFQNIDGFTNCPFESCKNK